MARENNHKRGGNKDFEEGCRALFQGTVLASALRHLKTAK
jgi:hypothetical protein